MQRRIFSPREIILLLSKIPVYGISRGEPREIILPKAKLARSAISWGKFSMPILFLAWFFVWGQTASAVAQPDHLWHFDECEGNILQDSSGSEDLPQNAIWAVGKWQCAVNQPYQAQYYIEKTFSQPFRPAI